ncbi:MAG: EscU/YscU/HrcU family type III secretion system export apparatus switch protein [Balneolaceae bacterium]|nr:MAG: EscU/YscU/HrcU family type III secretion system export apparatus switch protein [Balneolaceae bacterium]
MSEKPSEQDKTEEPTEQKIKKAREEGNVSRSTEVSSVMLLVMATLILYYSGGWMYSRADMLFEYFFLTSAQPIYNIENAGDSLYIALTYGFQILMPLLIVLSITALIVNVAQTGPVWAGKKIAFKGNRIDPIKGFGKLFAMKSVVELAKGIVKILIVGSIIYFTVRGEILNFISFSIKPIGITLAETGEYILNILVRILAALIVLSALDALYQRFQHRKELKMTRQEVRDENKQMEGDPHIKGKRRQFAMQFSRGKRLDHAILSSDVVVTNPTHYAVALRYDPDNDAVPILMVKGMRKRALRIKEMAWKYDVPVYEDPPTARALYALGQEDEPIPDALYMAVAEILAYVFKMKQENEIN